MHAAGGNLNTIVDAYGNSAEAATLFGSMTSEQKIDAIYRQCFGRAADEAGRIWYAEQLTSGIMTQATIMLNVLNGASGDDATAAINKLAVAKAFTAAINSTTKVQGYGGDAAAASARTFQLPTGAATPAMTMAWFQNFPPARWMSSSWITWDGSWMFHPAKPRSRSMSWRRVWASV